MFIVQIVSPNGQVSWVTVRASNSSDARRIVQQGSEQGFIANQVFTADTEGQQAAAQAGNTTPVNQLPSFDAPAVGQGTDAPPATQPVSGGGAGEGAAGATTPILGSEELEFGPAFRAGLADRGITLGPGGGVAGRLAGLFRRPIESRAFANLAFNDPSIGEDATRESVTVPSFQDFVRTGDLFGAGAAQQARGLLEQARGAGNQFGALNPLAAGILNPATTGEAQTLGDIGREAARQRFGAFARFLPSSAEFGEQFLAQPQGTATTFADFLNRRIFGGNLG